MTQLTPNFDAVDLPENASWEDYIDWRSERERCGDNWRTAELEQALADYHTADTEIDTCDSENDELK